MYAGLWRALPGPVVVRLALLLVLLAGVIVVCFEWLFPLVASWLPYDETTVETTVENAASPTALAHLPHLTDTVRTLHG